MPNLLVTNLLSTKNVIIQDPSGFSSFGMNVPASGSKTAYVTFQQLAYLQPQLDALKAASEITWSTSPTSIDNEVDPASLKGKYCLAAIERVHMDKPALVLLPDLVHGDLFATAKAQLLTILAAWHEHLNDGAASPIHDADHKTADSTNLAAFPTAPTLAVLADMITVIGGVTIPSGAGGGVVAHGNQASVHFHDDTGLGGTGFTLPVDPPVTQDDCNDDINALKHAFNTHVGLASL